MRANVEDQVTWQAGLHLRNCQASEAGCDAVQFATDVAIVCGRLLAVCWNWRVAVEASFGIGERGDQIRNWEHRAAFALVRHFVFTGIAVCLRQALRCAVPVIRYTPMS